MPKTVALVKVRQAKNVNLRRRFVFTVAYNKRIQESILQKIMGCIDETPFSHSNLTSIFIYMWLARLLKILRNTRPNQNFPIFLS